MSQRRPRIVNVVGARPNFMKIAPLMAAYQRAGFDASLVHTGQHYDERMSDLFFRELQIPKPNINLGIGSGSHACQTAQIMTAFEPILIEQRPDAVLVVGDINSTVACGLVAVKLGIKLIHVEAGLRSFDRTMPEEINRVVTDAISSLLFCTEDSGVENLRREGIDPDRIFMVGNLMIDTLLKNRAQADSSRILEELNLEPRGYALLTLHRPSNVDDSAAFTRLLDAIDVIQQELPVVFPIHPRTRRIIESPALRQRFAAMKRLRLIEPAGYLDFIKLASSAKIVLTDSGGIQEETTILQVPCLTLRDNTERPVTVTCGTNVIVGTQPDRIINAFRHAMDSRCVEARVPPLWDGFGAARVIEILQQQL
jgi:UDP-N-acetylglucosamine 2-epimerase (non-hydrolysing)